MTQIVRLGDTCTGHGCYSPRNNVSASNNVFSNNKPVHRVGDAWSVHCLHASTLVRTNLYGWIRLDTLMDKGIDPRTTVKTLVNKDGKTFKINSKLTGIYFKGTATRFIRIIIGSRNALLTPDHQVLVDGTYITAEELMKTNNPVADYYEEVIFNKPQRVYDLRVDNNFDAHNFLIENGLFVHNCCGPVCHSGTMASGSPNVYANNKPVARKNDPVSCGSKAMTHSSNVYAN